MKTRRSSAVVDCGPWSFINNPNSKKCQIKQNAGIRVFINSYYIHNRIDKTYNFKKNKCSFWIWCQNAGTGPCIPFFPALVHKLLGTQETSCHKSKVTPKFWTLHSQPSNRQSCLTSVFTQDLKGSRTWGWGITGGDSGGCLVNKGEKSRSEPEQRCG